MGVLGEFVGVWGFTRVPGECVGLWALFELRSGVESWDLEVPRLAKPQPHCKPYVNFRASEALGPVDFNNIKPSKLFSPSTLNPKP